ncbi:MAG: hypothetical protein WD226_00525 [Planctomycetota bacterium]
MLTRLAICLSGAWIAAATLGCQSLGGGDLGLSPSRVVITTGDPATQAVDGAHWGTIQTIRAALRERDDVTARALTERLALIGGDDVRELVAGFRRVLDGRALVAELDLRLVIETAQPDSLEPALDARRVLLTAEHQGQRPVRLRLPIGRLEHLVVGLEPTGAENRHLETTITHVFADVTLAPGRVTEFEVVRYTLPTESALAVRERWRLTFGDGHVEADGRELPAALVSAADAHGERLAPELPTAPVEPADLVAYAGGPRVFLPLLLEHAVRIAPERRDEAVVAILPLLEELAVDHPRRGRMLAPVLRWLTRSTEPGAEPTAWVAALHRHLSPTDSSLDLPDVR